MASTIHSAEQRLYSKLGMENPNKPGVYTSTIKEGPKVHRVRVVAHDGSKKIPPPVAAKPVFYRASVQPKPVPERAQAPSGLHSAAGTKQEKEGKSMEDELADLTDLLLKNLDNTSDPDFYGICFKCRKNVSGEGNGCNAMGNIYHVECFVCTSCKTTLTGKEFYCIEEQPYCEACYLDSLKECVVCANKITERILRAQGYAYHPECFVCSVCSRSLDNVPFTVDVTNQVHCVECYQL